jgi:hypothetical protein
MASLRSNFEIDVFESSSALIPPGVDKPIFLDEGHPADGPTTAWNIDRVGRDRSIEAFRDLRVVQPPFQGASHAVFGITALTPIAPKRNRRFGHPFPETPISRQTP